MLLVLIHATTAKKAPSDTIGIQLHGTRLFWNRRVSDRGLLARFFHLHGTDFRHVRLLSYIFLAVLSRALGWPHDLALCVSGFSFPACFQAAGKFEAWEDVRFGVDDDRVEG